VEFVASLVRHDPGFVQLWWPEWLLSGFDWDVNPDHLVVIDTGEASAFILVEVDESTERPPVIRDRLRAYAKLFENHQVGWQLLWVANSRERLARLRQVAGSMKDAMLSGRCWGVAIDDVSDRGADAEVLAIGAKDAPRPLRAIMADPKARRSSYPVGSPAWVRLLANGGREDISGLWHGAELEPAEGKTTNEAVEMIGARPEQEATPVLSGEPPAVEADAGQAFADAAEVYDDLVMMWPGELLRLILNSSSPQSRVERAVELLVERENWYDLFDAFEGLCKSEDPRRRLDGVHLIRRVRPSANTWLRQQTRKLLLDLIDGQNDQTAVDAALAALEETASG
jgi:hypothetical protein